MDEKSPEAMHKAILRLLDEQKQLRSVLGEVMDWIGNWDPSFIHDPEWSETQERVDAVLGKAAS